MNEIRKGEVYTNGHETVIADEVDQERATVIYEIISGVNDGLSKICSFRKFRKEYQEV